MRRLTLLLIAVLALTLLATTTASAQDAEQQETVFCGQLSEADCALLNESRTALWDTTSGETARTVAVYLVGFEGLPADQPALILTNRSMFVADPQVIDRMLALQAAGAEAVAADPAAAQEAMLLPLTIDTASATTVIPSAELSALLSGILNREIPAELTYENRLINGVLYIDLTAFSGFAPEIVSLGDWIGIDLMAFMPQVMETRVAEGDFELDELEEALVPPGQAMMAQPYLVMLEPDRAPVFNEFLEILPLRDTAIDDQIVAVYRMKMDVPGYVSSSAFLDRVPTLTQSIDNALPQNLQRGASDRDIAGSIVQTLGSVVLGNANAMVLQGIGYDDAYLYAMEMELGTQVGNRGVSLFIQSGNASMNDLEAIPVPANAFVPPLRLILGLIQAFGSD